MGRCLARLSDGVGCLEGGLGGTVGLVGVGHGELVLWTFSIWLLGDVCLGALLLFERGEGAVLDVCLDAPLLFEDS